MRPKPPEGARYDTPTRISGDDRLGKEATDRLGDVQLQSCHPVNHDGKEGRRRGDHERYPCDRIVGKCIDIQQSGADAEWDIFIERSVRWVMDSIAQGAPEH